MHLLFFLFYAHTVFASLVVGSFSCESYFPDLLWVTLPSAVNLTHQHTTCLQLQSLPVVKNRVGDLCTARLLNLATLCLHTKHAFVFDHVFKNVIWVWRDFIYYLAKYEVLFFPQSAIMNCFVRSLLCISTWYCVHYGGHLWTPLIFF